MRKDSLDGIGLAALIGVTLLLAVNQIIVKEVNTGLQPVFFAGLRSALAVVFVWAWLQYRGLWGRVRWSDLGPGLAIGTIFAAEFLCLFMALDLTLISRASIIFYSMPVWMGLLAHFYLPGERLTKLRGLGLLLAFGGTALAIVQGSKGGVGAGNLWGDLLALGGAWGWAGTAFLARKTRLREAGPEAQLFWMVLVSAPILLIVSPLFGPLLRDPQPLHWLGLLFQASVVVAGGFISWLWLLSVYPTSTVASFSFLTPLFAILLGSLIYAEPITLAVTVAFLLVALGIILVNRRP
jgi:drug/metabolite transporter (DMT)-like permease